MGCAGPVANAINTVYCTYASSRGHAQVGARLYLPQEWTSDPQRCARAGVDDDVVFATKPQLAVDLLTDLDTAGVLPPWVTADEVYGRDPTLRAFVRRPRRRLRTRDPVFVPRHTDLRP
ncbi:MAG: transposase [Pseudonocardiaceae bacterium]